MQVRKDELKPHELRTLERLAGRGPHLNLSWGAVERLMELGLVEQRLGGPGISQAGRALLAQERAGDRSRCRDEGGSARP